MTVYAVYSENKPKPTKPEEQGKALIITPSTTGTTVKPIVIPKY
ncbi:hypothetical protein PYS60_00380 [Amygdalobacter indicium]|nr:hypothetical protein [Amygdalobacter indicium]WEG34417.1 hypothetical protein PYS60_00380 [Amygdalobacter indicium]